MISIGVMTGSEFKARRLELGLSQKLMAEKVGVSRVTIARWEKSNSVPETVANLLNAYQIDTRDSNLASEPNGIWVNYNSFKLVPLISQRAQAGVLNNWDDEEFVRELPKIPWEVDKEYKGKYLTFEVSGDSMESDEYPRDSIFDGDLLLCREVMRQHWSGKLHINKWDFVVVHRDMGILAKRIIEHEVDTGKLILKSLNSYYDDQVVMMDDLLGIFNIVDVKRSKKRR